MTTTPDAHTAPHAPYTGPREAQQTSPDDDRQTAYDAVYTYIRRLGDEMPGNRVDRNAIIWHAVNAALDAPGTPERTLPREITHAFGYGLRQWLTYRGLDPDSPALTDTPARVLRALTEMTAGYDEDPAQILSRTFPVDHAGTPILVTGVPFTSLCAHHLLPFTGTADIAYQPAPGAPVAGLSKLPRVLDAYARRLQTQEELTQQVTTALDFHLPSMGSACVIRSEHGCLAHRGARKPGATMVTTSYTGVFLDDPEARDALHPRS